MTALRWLCLILLHGWTPGEARVKVRYQQWEPVTLDDLLACLALVLLGCVILAWWALAT